MSAIAGLKTDAVTTSVVEQFQRLYKSMPKVFRAPGRVNVIGEHTDYNDGFVMPAAIDLYSWVAIAPRPDRVLRFIRSNSQKRLSSQWMN